MAFFFPLYEWFFGYYCESSACLVYRQEVVLLDNEIVFNEAIIEEREQGIQEIQQQIGEVNEIFKDLAVLVHDQGAVIGERDFSFLLTVVYYSFGSCADVLAFGDFWDYPTHCDHNHCSIIIEAVVNFNLVLFLQSNVSWTNAGPSSLYYDILWFAAAVAEFAV
ncbi:hypothetical protein BHE74_00052257 [Ensete ventricosum]|nr:hypothetical protein GW17_00022272 [Ensete ventricosum]RWW42206.1 hypothetical protein BHE74_00052257 [Ensete ventricosum]RZS25470.1 hypothetical protein BHM03_00058671 [Ensete ventricosum]